MSAALDRLTAPARARIEAKGRRIGLAYPWWIPVLSSSVQIGGTVVALVQRDALAPPEPIALAVVLVAASCLCDFLRKEVNRWWVNLLLVCAGVAWLLTVPVSVGETADVAPGVLAFAVAEQSVVGGLRRGLVATAAGMAVVLVVGRPDAEVGPFYLGEIAFGMAIGYMLRWQMRALAAEETARDEERERATLAERQRVARDIHDLVAHSLSVTMLHVTGARRALSEHADVAEAVDALEDAERIGRQAMADIRRTVGLLNTEPSDARSLPGAADLDDLVHGFQSAGLSVEWIRRGDLSRLSPAAGLGVYRVVQESLANVAKHAPGARAVVELEIGAATRLSVTNPVPPGTAAAGAAEVAGSADGHGLRGMAARVEQLGGHLAVESSAERWRVTLDLPDDRDPRPRAVEPAVVVP